MMITGLHHVTLMATDLTKSRAFYEDVLGLCPDTTRPEMSFAGVWYALGAAQQLHLMQLPNVEAGLVRPAHGGRDRHVAFVVADLSQLQARLNAAGVCYTMSHSGRPALFCRDPEQNALEFLVLDIFPDEW